MSEFLKLLIPFLVLQFGLFFIEEGITYHREKKKRIRAKERHKERIRKSIRRERAQYYNDNIFFLYSSYVELPRILKFINKK